MTIFTPLFLIALGIFIWQCGKKLSLIRLGRPENRFDNPALRLWEMLLYAFGQKRVVARPFGLNHFVIFWAFIVLLAANGAFILEGLIPGFRLANVLPPSLYHPLVFAFDIVSFLALGAIVLSFARRLLFKPPYLDSAYVNARSFEAFLILSFIALLMLASFGLNGVKISLGIEPADFMPVSTVAAALLEKSGSDLETWGAFFWWLHAGVLLAFICFLPMSKHMHILTAIPNCFFQNLGSISTQPREEFAAGNSYGVEKVTDFTWKDLLDSFTCTECGRCQDACPANATGKSLNPRQVVHSLKVNLLANAPALKAGEPPRVPLIGAEGEGTNTEETIWACTTCGACLQACPVMIEHLPKLVGMRRHLVEMESKFPEELLNLFENMEQRSNPWGIAPGERTKWTAQMDVKPFEAGKTEYLLYVGCAGSFDSRSKQVTVNLAAILDAAGVSWGILGKDEKCCGDSLRRLGNEYIFDRMAKENVALFRERGVTKVITMCPHCFTTLRNDYRQYGIELEVIHHSELIKELLATGRLKLNRQVGELGKIIFHDSCYLGRHNDVYDAPRQVVATVTGAAPAEFDRAREGSFCCGAGGGRMWMEELTGIRINLNRVTEALEKRPDTICVACPYCMTMFEDGLKDKQAGQTRVRDIAEVVAEGMRPQA
ncbi:(Fe-S)-binding protein [Geobacter sp.]|uniref:(Fe-S)-binding protein n=1 Tax=Geobacter sp. TaxID=46610 RepID=UPI00261E9028|nr:(Fe-S)-binding protein [Geobacter sp.]